MAHYAPRLTAGRISTFHPGVNPNFNLNVVNHSESITGFWSFILINSESKIPGAAGLNIMKKTAKFRILARQVLFLLTSCLTYFTALTDVPLCVSGHQQARRCSI